MKEKLIEKFDPQPEVRKNAETAKDWLYQGEAVYLYRTAVLLRDRLVDPLHHVDRERLPEPIIAFENLRNINTLAAFRLTRNPQGMKNEIIMNTEHYSNEEGKLVWRFGKWAQLETLCHELVHEHQQCLGKDPISLRRIYHNKEFVEKCESLGLHPKLGEGYHLKRATEPFSILMKELGIQPEKDIEIPPDLNIDWYKWMLDFFGKGKKGKSSLNNWMCPECGIHARMGIKGNPEIIHDPCSLKKGEKVFFVKADGIAHTIYKAPK